MFPRLTAPGRPPRYMPDWEAAAELKQDVLQPLKPGQTVETKVGGLKHRAEYQFRVIAVNKAGNSPESEATDYHLVKHRARECPPHWATFPPSHAPTPSPSPSPSPSLSCSTGVPSPQYFMFPSLTYVFLAPICWIGHLLPALYVPWALSVYLWPYLLSGPYLFI